MAGDNDLASFAERDIHEMEKEGSNATLTVVVQVDRRGAGGSGSTLRGKILRDPNWLPFEPHHVTQFTDVGETNTGDPAVLRDFIVDSIALYPADAYALIVWNHGSGWKPEFIYEVAKNLGGSEMAGDLRAVDFAVKLQTNVKRLLFRRSVERKVAEVITVVEQAVSAAAPLLQPRLFGLNAQDPALRIVDAAVIRAIALDETSGDALESAELEGALVTAKEALIARGILFERFNILAFDACLMAGVEVVVQIRELCDYVVGSEEIEPGIGWGYTNALGCFVNNANDTRSLAAGLVDAYIESTKNYLIRLVTQSAIASERIVKLLDAIQLLGSKLVAFTPAQYMLLAQAEKQATRFYDKDYLDLLDYCDRLKSLNISPEISAVCDVVTSQQQQCIVASRHAFEKPGQRPGGISIYYPAKPSFEPAYEALRIAPAISNWIHFIKRYHFLT